MTRSGDEDTIVEMTYSGEKFARWRMRATAADTWGCEDEGAASIVPLGSEMDMMMIRLSDGLGGVVRCV